MKKIEDIVKKNSIVLFDGVCNLCDQSVQFIIKNDKKNVFLFSPLQNEEIQIYLKDKSEDLNNANSVLLITKRKIYTKSSAALIIAKLLGGVYGLLYVFYIIPKPIRDIVYDFIAKNRYKWYGKKEQCMVPDTELKNKFL